MTLQIQRRRNNSGFSWSTRLYVAAVLAMSFSALGQLHIPPTLRDEITGREIADGTRNLVICIHGWNPSGKADKYTEAEWDWLVFNMKQALPGNSSDPWALLLYHWETDANTGFVDWTQVGYYWQATANAATAGANGWEHGISLGARLPSSLRKVHIIAHSAGAWCAYQTASALLANPYTVVQVTLLDPYIPDEVPGLQGSYPTLSKATINGMANWPSGFSTRFSLLENYFADDSVSGTIPNFPANIIPAGVTFGTQTTFSWRARDINLQVDWSFSAYPYRTGLADLYYDWHSGPVLFYGDTIEAANGGTVEPGLPSGGLPFDYNLNGWKQSLFYRFQSGLMTRITAQPQRTTSVVSGASVTLSAGATSLLPFNFQWFKRGQDAPISGATFGYYTFTASSATAGDYVVRLLDSGGNMIFSDFATVTVTDAPPVPTAPSIASVSPSTLPPSFSPQLINIYGSNFKAAGDPNASTLIFRDPANIAYVRTPIFVSSSQLQYNITVQSAVGTWSVTVTNAGQAASNLKTFLVAAPPPNTGSLTVNLFPAGAVSAGAQWRVDGGSYRNDGDTATGLTPGLHTVSFKAVSGYTTPADKSVSITSGANTTDSGTYTLVANCTYSLSSYGDTWAAAGGSDAFNVIAPAGCAWSASESLNWVSITSGSSGSGTHGVFYQVDYNPSVSPRSGVITAAGQSFTINQNGNGNACTFALSAPGSNVPAEGGTNSFSVTTGSICFWSTSRNAIWITITSPQDHTGSDFVQYTVQPHFGSVPRSAAILLSVDGGQTFVATFTITQAETPPPPGTLATGLSYPVSVAVDDNHAYWTEASGKVLKRVSKSGGGETVLATNLYAFGQMVLDGNYLYYLDSGTKVQKLSTSGGTPPTLATGSSFYDAITVRDNVVYWGASGVIYSVPTGGGSVTAVATSSQDIASIRVTNNAVFWSQTLYPGTVFVQPLSGGPRVTLPSGWNVEPGLAIQGNFVYSAGAESIYRVPTNRGSVQALATNLNDAYDLALDGTNIYWVEAGNANGTNGSVRQMPLNAGPIITLGTNLAQPVAITIDSTNVYWLERNNGKTTRSALKRGRESFDGW
jgi:hypothetical protein